MDRIQRLKEIAQRHGVSPIPSSEQKLSDEAGEPAAKPERLSIARNILSDITDPNTETTGQQLCSSENSSEKLEAETPIAESETRGPPNVAMMRQVLWQTMMDMKAGKISIEKTREISNAANVIYKFVRLELDAQKMAKSVK